MIETNNKCIAVLMATHPRLGGQCILPNDMIVKIASFNLFHGEVN